MLVIPTADGQEQPLPDLPALLTHTLTLKTSCVSTQPQNKVQTQGSCISLHFPATEQTAPSCCYGMPTHTDSSRTFHVLTSVYVVWLGAPLTLPHLLPQLPTQPTPPQILLPTKAAPSLLQLESL